MTRVDVIKARLLEDSVISALVGEKIYYQTVPATIYTALGGYTKTAFPFIVIRQIGSSYSLINDPDIREYAYTFECYSNNISEATRLGTYVKYELDLSRAKKLTDANVKIVCGVIGGERTNSDESAKIFQYDIDVLITFEEKLTW